MAMNTFMFQVWNIAECKVCNLKLSFLSVVVSEHPAEKTVSFVIPEAGWEPLTKGVCHPFLLKMSYLGRTESLGAAATNCVLPNSGPEDISSRRQGADFITAFCFDLSAKIAAPALFYTLLYSVVISALLQGEELPWWAMCLMELCKGGGPDRQQIPWLHHFPPTFLKSCSSHESATWMWLPHSQWCKSFSLCLLWSFLLFSLQKFLPNTQVKLFLSREVETHL